MGNINGTYRAWFEMERMHVLLVQVFTSGAVGERKWAREGMFFDEGLGGLEEVFLPELKFLGWGD